MNTNENLMCMSVSESVYVFVAGVQAKSCDSVPFLQNSRLRVS